jgi:hypothetical protein
MSNEALIVGDRLVCLVILILLALFPVVPLKEPGAALTGNPKIWHRHYIPVCLIDENYQIRRNFSSVYRKERN